MEELLRQSKPNSTDSTITTNLSAIRRICRESGISYTPESLINNSEKIEEFLLEQDPKTRKNLVSPLLNIYRIKDQDLYDTFKQILDDAKEKIDDHTIIGKKTPKQEANWLDLDVVMKKYKELEEEIQPFYTLNGTFSSNEHFYKVETYILLSCCLLIPPRRSLDYTAFKLRDIDTDNDNYMTYDMGRKPYFVFNKYKTSHKYGKDREEIPIKLRNIILKWKTVNKSDWLLPNRHGGPIAPSRVNAMLNGFFGKKIGTSLLRNIVISWKDKQGELETKGQRKKLAKQMAHSVEVQQYDYKKT